MRPRGIVLACVLVIGCSTSPPTAAQHRFGDEIIVAGRYVRIGTPVITWLDPDGYDGYRTDRVDPLAPLSMPSTVPATLPATLLTTMPTEWFGQRTRGTSFVELQRSIDQFVLHYDVSGTSRRCFIGLHDYRGLSVHFLLDLDGTIYQTLDVKERAWHATISNDRSVGIEIANIGSYAIDETQAPLQSWYKRGEDGLTFIDIPPRSGGLAGQRTKPFVLRPAQDAAVVGQVQGVRQRMYDFTPQQYAALIKLTAALCDTLPLIRCDYPRDAAGNLITHVLSENELRDFRGILGHYHVQANKRDPGPALRWEVLLERARNEIAKRRVNH